MNPQTRQILLDIGHGVGFVGGLALLVYGVYSGNTSLLAAGGGLTATTLGTFTWGHAALAKVGGVEGIAKDAESLLPLVPAQYQSIAKAVLGDIEGAMAAIDAAAAAPLSTDAATKAAQIAGAAAEADPKKVL